MSASDPSTPADSKKPSAWATRADAAVTLALAGVLAVSVLVIVIRNHRAGQDIQVVPADAVAWRVDVNQAQAAELMLLPGIGRVRAEKILAWRRDHGRFAALDDVRRAAGLTESAFEEIRSSLTLGEAEKANQEGHEEPADD